MKIGIIGIGHLGSALVRGYVAAGLGEDLILSPRGRDQTALLRAEFGLQIAIDNADVVRQSNVVIIAVRPNDVIDTVRMLPWQEKHTVICAAAGISLGALRGAVVPGIAVRAMPVMASAVNESAIPLYPATGTAVSALGPLGRVTPCQSEDVFTSLSALGAWFGWLFALTGATAERLIDQGVQTETARRATADMMRAAGAYIAANPQLDPMDTLRSLATPGGITEAGMRTLNEADALHPWSDAMDAALERLQELGEPDGD